MSARSRWSVVLLAALITIISAFLAFHHLGANSVFADEALIANIARNVAVTDRWYPIDSGGARHVSKPPLSVWPMALRFEMAGVSEENVRIESAIGGVIASLLLFALGTWLLDAYAGTLAALLLISAPSWLLEHGVREGVGDVWTTIFTSIALVAYVRGRISQSRGLPVTSILVAATGSLIKGPVVFLVLFSVGLAWEITTRSLHGRRPRWLLLSTVVLLSAVPFALWVVDNAAHDALARAKLWDQFIGRHTHGIDPTHLHGLLFYPHVLAASFGVWLLVLAAPALWRWLQEREVALLLPLWAMLPVVLFSLSPSKLSWYIDPALPPLALLMAIAIRIEIARLRSWKLQGFVAAVVAVALAMRVGSAASAVHAAPRRTDMHTFVLAYRAAPRPTLYVHTLEAPGYRYREWNYFYLDQLPRQTRIPETVDRSRCNVVVTLNAGPLLSRPDFAGAATWQFHKYDAREADLWLIDLCGGTFVRALAAPR